MTSLKCVLGVLSALHRCLLESPGSACDSLDRSVTAKLLKLLENISLLLLGALYGDVDACLTEMGTETIYRYRLSAFNPSKIYPSLHSGKSPL